ncbi:RNA pseudouridylate synthase domain-containing protein 2 [Eufriesea mexicana]|uniref:Pseudouridine synthase n=1 Tax=Eufriesea mexicana TaxID=516756 RepID=A0A310SG57_9HYME|nr:RNA pseudouridylate synthase domain-containing protein 2 [Eufriesea mexicana]
MGGFRRVTSLTSSLVGPPLDCDTIWKIEELYIYIGIGGSEDLRESAHSQSPSSGEEKLAVLERKSPIGYYSAEKKLKFVDSLIEVQSQIWNKILLHPTANYTPLAIASRHEVPVTSEPITVIHMDEDVVVVNKPASIPVHPCGRYRHNTVVFILAKEYNLKNLRTIHRLDRLTSGILLFGRTPKKARQMEHQIRNRQVSFVTVVHKQYVCRVEGEFPEEEVVCSEPIEVVSYKIGVCKVSEKGKDCVTRFKRLSYNGKSSVVLCKPQTGRMHQIRVHLQYLGYPVVNDPLYNHVVFGPEKGKGGNIGKTDQELVRDLISIHNAENWLGMDGDSEMSLFKPKLDMEERVLSNDKDGSSPSSTPGLGEEEQQQQQEQSLKVTVGTQTGSEPPDSSFTNDKMTVDPHCYECKVKYRDPKPSDLVMYLHAWRYCGPGWEYETPLPAWAASDWAEEDR